MAKDGAKTKKKRAKKAVSTVTSAARQLQALRKRRRGGPTPTAEWWHKLENFLSKAEKAGDDGDEVTLAAAAHKALHYLVTSSKVPTSTRVRAVQMALAYQYGTPEVAIKFTMNGKGSGAAGNPITPEQKALALQEIRQSVASLVNTRLDAETVHAPQPASASQ